MFSLAGKEIPKRLPSFSVKPLTANANAMLRWCYDEKVYSPPLTPILHLISSFQMNYFKNAERLNGLAAMIGIAAALGAYALTGQIIPGVW